LLCGPASLEDLKARLAQAVRVSPAQVCLLASPSTEIIDALISVTGDLDTLDAAVNRQLTKLAALLADQGTAATTLGVDVNTILQPPARISERELLHHAKLRRASLKVQQEELKALARRVVDHFTEPYTRLSRVRDPNNCTKWMIKEKPTCARLFSDSCRLLSDIDTTWSKSVDIFDFTERSCVADASRLIGEQLFLPVGDSLQEPFWPEGLGINRGIHNALDACWVANLWAMSRNNREKQLIREERQYLYEHFTIPLSGGNRQVLKGYNAHNGLPLANAKVVYTADPDNRYNGFCGKALTQWATQARNIAQASRESNRAPVSSSLCNIS